MIQRDTYFNKLLGFKNKHIIKIITGIRRCGKSTLLEMYQRHLLRDGVSETQIISINFEHMRYSHLTDAKALHDYVSERLIPDKMNYVFLDEVQNVHDFQRAVDSLFIQKNVDIYLTGSNAYMLSGEIATLLSGRYVEIATLPLSFKEYVASTGSTNDLSRKYTDYLTYSAFPFTMELDKDDDRIQDYLNSVYNTVILRDVVARKNISDVMMLESVIRFMFDNIGNLMSTKKISDTMTADGRKISTHTVESYISALVDSFVLYRAKRYDVKGRQHLKTNDKYYVVDIGLRRAILGDSRRDVGHILENVIYLELLRRGYDVYVGKYNSTEIDFVALRKGATEYFQVAATVREKDTLERELLSLNSIQDHYPKTLITLDDDPPADYNGIRQINALDFLMAD
ncbi:ATP-binding protein [Ruminococcaceae bacterium OttesenSCG-928-D13]|nr:ATP-binding protein [Ruminococcaceae bacterium OttesenSCG-928-D13]